MPGLEYIYIPRGRVVYDIGREVSIVYIDKCLEKEPGVLARIVRQFALNKYEVKHDEHYVCSECMREVFY